MAQKVLRVLESAELKDEEPVPPGAIRVKLMVAATPVAQKLNVLMVATARTQPCLPRLCVHCSARIWASPSLSHRGDLSTKSQSEL